MRNTEEEKIEEVIPEVKLEDCKILFLDVSSSCTGYSIARVNFLNKSAKLLKSGPIWLDKHWEHAKKYDYLYNLIQNYFEVIEQVDYIVVEQYSVNTSKMSGVLVSPEAHGTIKAAAFSNGVKVASILPQTWRSQLGIKPLGPKGKRDYKTPTKELINSIVTVPDKIKSNLTGKDRATPSDVYDSIGICLGWLKKNNINKVSCSDCTFEGIFE